MSGFLCHWEGVSEREQVQKPPVSTGLFHSLTISQFLTVQYVRLFSRFAVALEQFSDSLQMVKNQITPGKLTWPLTKEVVKETEPDYFKVCCLCRVVFISNKQSLNSTICSSFWKFHTLSANTKCNQIFF